MQAAGLHTTNWSRNMHTLHIKDGYIKLGQALKAAGVTESGAEAKHRIQAGEVKVNGQVETQRGRKLVAGDKVELEGKVVQIKQ